MITGILSITVCFININTIFPIKLIIYFLGFFLAGIFLINNLHFLKKPIVIGISGIGTFLIILYCLIESTTIGYWGNYVFPFVICVFVLCLFVNIKKISQIKCLKLCGKYSLEIYLMHCYITAANRIILMKLGITNFWCNVAVNLIMATCIPIILALILKKLNIAQYIFGMGKIIVSKCKVVSKNEI